MSDQPTLQDSHMSSAPADGGTPVLGASWQEQDGILRDLWMQNKTPQQIGEILGRSVPAIMTRAARLGLPRRSAPGRKPGAASTRRLPSAHEVTNAPRRTAPRAEATDTLEAPPQASLRVCLMCLRKFESAGRHNRICMPCKGSAEYSQAATLPDVHLPQG